MGEAKKMSFELNEEMLALIEKEFAPEKVVSRFSEAVRQRGSKEVERVGQEVFTQYGVELMKRSHQLGEEYPDRTYEVLREASDATGGGLVFPLIPQRFIEIAFLSTQHLSVLPVLENNSRRLIFQVPDCKIYDQVRKQLGEGVAQMLTCKHGCLRACGAIFKDFGFEEVVVEMNAATHQAGYCEFMVRRV